MRVQYQDEHYGDVTVKATRLFLLIVIAVLLLLMAYYKVALRKKYLMRKKGIF